MKKELANAIEERSFLREHQYDLEVPNLYDFLIEEGVSAELADKAQVFLGEYALSIIPERTGLIEAIEHIEDKILKLVKQEIENITDLLVGKTEKFNHKKYIKFKQKRAEKRTN